MSPTLLSIDLSNYCTKQCSFCYNHSNREGNVLWTPDKIESAKAVFQQMIQFLNPDQIILIPQRFSNTPTPKELASVAGGKAFQSPSCLLKCARPTDLVSVSYDKKANSCSYASGKQPLKSLDYKGLINALNAVEWKDGCR